jgi:microcystin-dependent protein
MSVYNLLGIDVTAPIGSINSYMGTSDPDGWVICDGVTRANNGIYNNLLNMLIGSGTPGTTSNPTLYTPPNLKTRYLRGGTSSSAIKQNVGSGSVTLNTTHMASHTHTLTITDPTHSHNVTQHGSSTIYYMGANGLITSQTSGTIGNKATGGSNARTFTASNATAGVSMTAGNTGSGVPITLTPSYVYVNYILKY